MEAKNQGDQACIWNCSSQAAALSQFLLNTSLKTPVANAVNYSIIYQDITKPAVRMTHFLKWHLQFVCTFSNQGASVSNTVSVNTPWSEGPKMHIASPCYCQPGLAIGLFSKRQPFSCIQFVLLSSSCKKWSIAKRRLITVTGVNIIRDMILIHLRQRTGPSTSISFVKWIWKTAAGLWGWIYTSRLSWFKRSLVPKEDIPLRVASPCALPEEATALTAPCANAAQLTNTTGFFYLPPAFENQGCAGLEGWRRGVWRWESAFAAEPSCSSSSSWNTQHHPDKKRWTRLASPPQTHKSTSPSTNWTSLSFPQGSLSVASLFLALYLVLGKKKNILVKEERRRGVGTKLHSIYSGPSVILSLKVLFLYHCSVPTEP